MGWSSSRWSSSRIHGEYIPPGTHVVNHTTPPVSPTGRILQSLPREDQEIYMFTGYLVNHDRVHILYMNVGMMKDQKVKMKDLHVSHTLGYVRDGNT